MAFPGLVIDRAAGHCELGTFSTRIGLAVTGHGSYVHESRPVRAPARSAPKPAESAPRADIQGLRALAVGSVVAYHLWPDALPGGFVGVDVFLVISGFLITTHLLRRWPESLEDLTHFWVRRIKRLLPAALLVIAVTFVAVRGFAPETEWERTARDATASALYFQNWRLADSSVDYMAADQEPGALQHYWSLSVEEQFYLFWPILFLACALLARGAARRAHGWAFVGMASVLGASLVWSIAETARNPAAAYFVTTTRVWELALGGLLAALVAARARTARVRRPSRTWSRTTVASIGLIAICVASYRYSSATAFPGYTALLPVVGAALVIAADVPQGRGTNRVLGWRPAQYLGDISYSVYLWHWPLIVVTPWAIGTELTFDHKVGILGLTVALAALTKRYVEDPARTRTWTRPVLTPTALAALGMSAVVAAGLFQVGEVDRRIRSDAQEILARSNDPCFAAASMESSGARCSSRTFSEVLPRPALASRDAPDTAQEDCRNDPPFTRLKSCVYGDPEARVRIALIGNSHAEHWLPALQRMFEGRSVAIETFLAGRCFPNAVPLQLESDRLTENCRAWSAWATDQVEKRSFDLVIYSSRTDGKPKNGGDPLTTFQVGYESTLRRWIDAGKKVLVIRDTPVPYLTKVVAPDCVATQWPNVDRCAALRTHWLKPDPLVKAVRKLDHPAATYVDMNDFICQRDRCDSVVGGALVYMDGSHLTATYSRSLAPFLERHVLRALGRVDQVGLDPDQG
ncbi:acyltransferase family protein [Sporichthya brevicatena]|uniref:Acyltransferase family protein n=1 Tax=Sporichthya brevicatena TaxID=171442 RepID=A0ABN1GZX4_9ACTN